MNETPSVRDVKSVRRMFQLVETLIERDGAQVVELAEELDLAKSTVHQHLSTLRKDGYLVKEDGEYQVGLRFLSIGEYAQKRQEEYHLAKPMVEKITEKTDERAQFFVEEHGRAIYLYTQSGEQGVKADRQIGERRYLHSSAGGKAILAHMDRDRIETVLDRWGLPAETEHTITSRDRLFEEVAAVRERGFSINKEESIPGLWAIGVPVVANGDVVGAFSVSGPRHRMENDWFHQELPDLLLGTANELQIKIEYS